MSSTDRLALWDQLKQAEYVDGDMPETSDAATPWYVRTMLGITGWLGALLVLSFVVRFVTDSSDASLVMGAMFCVAAAAIFRTKKDNNFAIQFAFAVSLAGQGLILIGLGKGTPSQPRTLAMLMAMTEVLLFLSIPNFMHRVWSATIGLCCLVFVLNSLGLYPYTPVFLIAGFSWAWLNEFNYPRRGALIRAIGYGLTLTTIISLSVRIRIWFVPLKRGAVSALGGSLSPLICSILIGGVLIWVVLKLLSRKGAGASEKPFLTAAIFLAMVSIKAPGIALTLVILMIGYANGNRVLAGLGIVSLLGYLSKYYYMLELTLLQKSILLLCSGFVLLAARVALNYYWPPGEEVKDFNA